MREESLLRRDNDNILLIGKELTCREWVTSEARLEP